MNKIDGLNQQQRNAFDNLLKSLLDAQDEFEMGIQNNQSNVVTGFLHRFIQFMNQLAPAGLVLRLTAWAMKRAYRKTID